MIKHTKNDHEIKMTMREREPIYFWTIKILSVFHPLYKRYNKSDLLILLIIIINAINDSEILKIIISDNTYTA